jgi:surface protein
MAKRTPTLDELNKILPFPKGIDNIIHGYVGNPFIITLKITKDINLNIDGTWPHTAHGRNNKRIELDKENRTIKIPSLKAKDGIYIEWGDGITQYIPQLSHDYGIMHEFYQYGEYIVHIFGDITKLSCSNMHKLIDISQWGNLCLYSCMNTFEGCENLQITAVDYPNLKNVKDSSGMFSDCTNLRANLSKWDVSNITDMGSMFSKCINFNSDLSMWDVSNVKYMFDMFGGCELFESDLSKWNVSNVTEMGFMFKGCTNFTSDLSSWNVSNVKYMFDMFSGCDSFKSDLSKWDISNLQDISNRDFKQIVNIRTV